MYLVEVTSQDREMEAIRHIVGRGSFHKERLLSSFGLGQLAFIIIEAQKPKLTPGIFGDVDILAGNLDFQNWDHYRDALHKIELDNPDYPDALKSLLAGKMVSEAGGLQWPPKPTVVTGIEVKCSYFTDRLRAAKSSPRNVERIRSQVEWLEKMGLDGFGLLDVIGNEPAYQENGGYFGALHRASVSLDAMSSLLRERLPSDSRAAQLVWSAGSVGGGDEGMRGAGGLHMLRQPQPNALLEARDSKTWEHRENLLRNITALLADLPTPRYFPVTLRDCMKCRGLHFLDDPTCKWNSSIV